MNTAAVSSKQPSRGVANRLTLGNVGMLVSMLATFVGLRFIRAQALDVLAPILFWSWAALTPVLSVLALRIAKRLSSEGLIKLNALLLAFWGIALLGLLLLH